MAVSFNLNKKSNHFFNKQNFIIVAIAALCKVNQAIYNETDI